MGIMISPGGRLFDTSTGRFLSRDPVRPPGRSPYEGLGSNPQMVVDPNGRQGAGVPFYYRSFPVDRYVGRLESIFRTGLQRMKKLCVAPSGAINLGKLEVLKKAVRKAGVSVDPALDRAAFTVTRGPGPFFIGRETTTQIEVPGPIRSPNDREILEEAIHASLFFAPGTGNAYRSDDLASIAIAVIQGHAYQHLERLDQELQDPLQCDHLRASQYWSQFVYNVKGYQQRVGALLPALRSATGISIDMDAIREYYLAGKCGRCCAESPISDIIAGGYYPY